MSESELRRKLMDALQNNADFSRTASNLIADVVLPFIKSESERLNDWSHARGFREGAQSFANGVLPEISGLKGKLATALAALRAIHTGAASQGAFTGMSFHQVNEICQTAIADIEKVGA